MIEATAILSQEAIAVINSVTGGVTPTGTMDIESMEKINVAQYEFAQVVDADLVPENIKKDVDILGVIGTYEA